MPPMNKKERGDLAEEIACRYLIEQGLEILARNYYVRAGELDIVALDKDVLVFVEVRSKTKTAYGMPEETVSLKKQRFLYRAAEQYLIKEKKSEMICRFDVISVLFTDRVRVNWYKDAFRL